MTLPIPEHPRRLVYFGTPEMAVPTLEALVRSGYDVALVVTRADKRRGRGTATAPSPVKAAATALGLPVTASVDDALEVGADLGVVVAFGRLLKPHLLAALPMVNIHFSLLPRWRGAAPLERALLAGDPVTGVCLMDVVDELDAGDLFSCVEVPIEPGDTAGTLRARLVDAGTALLLDGLANGFGEPRPQVGEPTYAAKLSVEELRLDWQRPSAELDRVVRVGNAWTTMDGKRLKVWAARPVPAPPAAVEPGAMAGPIVRCRDGGLELVEVQPEGKRRMAATEWLHGHPGAVRLGT